MKTGMITEIFEVSLGLKEAMDMGQHKASVNLELQSRWGCELAGMAYERH